MSNSFSHWMRVDLHIHTDWSKKTKHGDYKGQFSVDTLHTKLSENEVEIFSLTDHNIINIDAYTEYYEKYDSEGNPLLLVGVELDIIVEQGTSETYHTLIIFNYTNIEGATYVHEKLEEKYIENNLEPTQRVLTMGEVIDIFPDDDFFFIPHAGNTKGITSPYRDNIPEAQQMIILMQSAMEKVKAQRRHTYNEGFNKILTKAFRDRENHAYIEFSDNHCIESYPKKDLSEDSVEHSFYYVKGRNDFETLRQAFIDPQSRIMSSLQYEAIRYSPRYIESLELSSHSIIEGQKITFSPHLNVLIGGRSSGKSLLLSILSDKIDSIQNKANRNYPVESSKITIKAFQDSSHILQTSINSKRLTYIGQGEIVNYFEQGNLSELATTTGANESYTTAKQEFLEHKQRLQTTLNNLITYYQDCATIENEKIVLHSSTIDHLLGDNFTFI